ncbi:MAG: hypothetical protein ABIC91_08315 [Nanoarchaeota archaeon]|nr:hypothetical protein [Nanoarchaeota archaeon]MBU1030962.1 hypothetical protein [Nanoarchaeota archaeon]MBU1849887.1 hypothetical protein [Nanoarchaeota archaeon]
MKNPSIIGESAAVIAVLDFIYWLSANTPKWSLIIWISFAILFLIDWMLGGVADKGICTGMFKKSKKSY